MDGALIKKMSKGTVDQTVGSESIVSIIMANYCGARFVERALQSVLSQTHTNIEVIAVDDASTDDSVEILRRIAATDPRVIVVASERNLGPGASRNRALAKARGEWVAIVDSDDIIHPERIERLLRWAEDIGTDAVADDLIFFPSNSASSDRSLLGSLKLQHPVEITAERFLECDVDGSNVPPLGYLKPMLRRRLISDMRYPEQLKIGEDYEFLLNFLLDKGSMHIVPEALYLYRRHSASISFRLSETTVAEMIAHQKTMLHERAASPEKIKSLMEERLSSLQKKLEFERLISAIKSKHWAMVFKFPFKNPNLITPLCQSVLATLKRRLQPHTPSTIEGKNTLALFNEFQLNK